MTRLPRVVLVGSRGQVGSELSDLLAADRYEFLAVGRSDCDLSVRGAIGSVIRRTKPDVIVNAAAYTLVDKAESDVAQAQAVNTEAPIEMAHAAGEVGAMFVHYSTDYVFNGVHSTPWRESDPTGPLNVYGRTKLDGEIGVMGAHAKSIIFRTSWVFGARASNFLRTMLRLGMAREELTIVEDQVGAPTWSRSLAELAMHTIRRFTRPNGSINLEEVGSKAGVYHATCGGATNWFEFACAIFEEARVQGLPLKVRSLKPIRAAEYPSAAVRPSYSVMSNEKLKRELAFELPEWRAALKQVMREVAANFDATSSWA